MDQKLESSIKITNIQSLQHDIKEENQSESTIKIRSISEINQTHEQPQINNNKNNIFVTKQHPSQQPPPKQVVVRKIPENYVPIVQQRATANGSPKLLKSPPPIGQQPSFSIPPVLDNYIKELENQNKELKKVLLECRREIVSIQMRTHKLTNIINATISKANAKRPTLKQPAVSMQQMITNNLSQVQQQTSQQPAHPQQQQSSQQQSTMLQKKTFKVVPKRGNVTAKGNIICRVPIFPISRMQILKQLEIDLSKKEFSEYVFQKLYAVNNKSEIDKPSVLLNNTLNSIVLPKLMGQFQYEQSPNSSESSTDCDYFRSLHRVRVLYGKLVNALSNTIFSKSVDMTALEKFVKNKISSHRCDYLANCERIKAAKSIEMPPQVQIKMEKQDQPMNVDGNGQFSWHQEPMHTEED